VRFVDEDGVFALVAATCAVPLAVLQPPFTVVPGGASGRGPAAPEPRWAERVREKPGQGTLGFEPGPGSAPAPGEPASGAGAASAAAGAAGPGEPEMWQLHRTYLLAPVRGGLVIIDQHAAHERVLFEEAMARFHGAPALSQQLLFPAVVDLSADQFDLLLELGPWLKQLGWDLRALGPPTVVVQGIPGGLPVDRPGAVLQDVLDGMGDGGPRVAHEEVMERLARSYACHAAVRAGDALGQAEMRSLVDRLFATSRPHGDPHGRVTFVRLDLEELHRRFGRS